MALNDLMERHATPLFHFLCRMLANEDDANDLAQETFVRVFPSRAVFERTKSFPPGSTPLLPIWRETISAGAHVIRMFRWKLKPAETEQISPAVCRPMVWRRTNRRWRRTRRGVRCRRKLPEDLRAAIVLCEWEERSVAEAASMLETTPKAVESRLYRARQILRERLK